MPAMLHLETLIPSLYAIVAEETYCTLADQSRSPEVCGWDHDGTMHPYHLTIDCPDRDPIAVARQVASFECHRVLANLILVDRHLDLHEPF